MWRLSRVCDAGSDEHGWVVQERRLLLMANGERGTVWTDRVNVILQDERKAKIAALLFYIIDQHDRQCFHKRTCPERSLYQEAVSYLNFVAAETATAETERGIEK
jgi:hypothetical protein